MRAYRDEVGRLIVSGPNLPFGACAVLSFVLAVCALPPYRLTRADAIGTAALWMFIAFLLVLGLAHRLRRTVFDAAAGTVEVDWVYVPRSRQRYPLRDLAQCVTRARTDHRNELMSIVYDVYLQWNGATPDLPIAAFVCAAEAAELQLAVQRYLRQHAPPTPVVRRALVVPVALRPVRISASAAHCGVCGDAMRDGCVRCPRCETPHHSDCWTYNAGCSVYGCGAH